MPVVISLRKQTGKQREPITRKREGGTLFFPAAGSRHFVESREAGKGSGYLPK